VAGTGAASAACAVAVISSISSDTAVKDNRQIQRLPKFNTFFIGASELPTAFIQERISWRTGLILLSLDNATCGNKRGHFILGRLDNL
jgi:hypothetical protein